MKMLVVAALSVSISVAQDVRQEGAIQPSCVPFASKGNVIELAVENESQVSASQVTVEATRAPSWLGINPKEIGVHVPGCADNHIP